MELSTTILTSGPGPLTFDGEQIKHDYRADEAGNESKESNMIESANGSQSPWAKVIKASDAAPGNLAVFAPQGPSDFADRTICLFVQLTLINQGSQRRLPLFHRSRVRKETGVAKDNAIKLVHGHRPEKYEQHIN